MTIDEALLETHDKTVPKPCRTRQRGLISHRSSPSLLELFFRFFPSPLVTSFCGDLFTADARGLVVGTEAEDRRLAFGLDVVIAMEYNTLNSSPTTSPRRSGPSGVGIGITRRAAGQE